MRNLPIYLRLRNWLIELLAGDSVVIVNADINPHGHDPDVAADLSAMGNQGLISNVHLGQGTVIRCCGSDR